MSNVLEPQIYVACLAAYVRGYLHGDWIDATLEPDEIHHEIQAILADSPVSNAVEWAIHDYMDFGKVFIHEYESIDSVHKKALLIAEHGELGVAILSYYSELNEAEEALSNNYYGEYGSELDFATEFFNELYGCEISNHLASYINYDAFCHDLFITDYMSFRIDGKTHVLSSY